VPSGQDAQNQRPSRFSSDSMCQEIDGANSPSIQLIVTAPRRERKDRCTCPVFVSAANELFHDAVMSRRGSSTKRCAAANSWDGRRCRGQGPRCLMAVAVPRRLVRSPALAAARCGETVPYGRDDHPQLDWRQLHFHPRCARPARLPAMETTAVWHSQRRPANLKSVLAPLIPGSPLTAPAHRGCSS